VAEKKQIKKITCVLIEKDTFYKISQHIISTKVICVQKTGKNKYILNKLNLRYS